ncbi:hypothetical protein N9W84_00275 [bacterium]|nr:hypothetical protein [bacterium]
MSKSKYPNKIDTSIELPVVRDNVTQVTSEVFNSLRSAVIQIEKTLGINPQGSPSETVSSRLEKSLDLLGNIKKDALNLAGVLTGPISDKDVSQSAKIKEEKIALNYSTNFLNTKVSSLQTELETFSLSINDLIAKISIHLNKDSLSQHKAKQIDVESATPIPSSNSFSALISESLQQCFERLVNSHILFNGLATSETNNSHYAKQIYFDNSEITNITDFSNVQDAINDIGLTASNGSLISNLNTTTNGVIRAGKVSNPKDNQDGIILINSASVSITSPTLFSETKIFFDTPQTDIGVSLYDIFILSGSSNNDDNKYYLIKEVGLNSNSQITSLTIFGGPKEQDNQGLSGIVIKNNYISYNKVGLACSVRPRYNKSNTPFIFSNNPNSSTVTSKGFDASLLTATSSTINITVDGSNSFDVDLYNSSYTNQTIDTAVFKINSYAIENKLQIQAFITTSNNCFEISISNVIPNFSGDDKNRTIKITDGSSNNGLTETGFSHVKDVEFFPTGSNSINTNGKILDSAYDEVVITNNVLRSFINTNKIISQGQNLYSFGIRRGDLVVTEGFTDTSNNGTFTIGNITDTEITLDHGTFLFSENSNENVKFIILKSTIDLTDFQFSEVPGPNSFALLDLFYLDRRSYSSKRLEYEGIVTNSGFSIIVTNVSKEYILENQTASITVDINKNASLTGPNGFSGESVSVKASGVYKLFSSDKLSFVEVKIVSGSSSTLTSSINMTLYGHSELPNNSLSIGRAVFSSELGYILGDDSGLGIPSISDTRPIGIISEKDISGSFLEKYIESYRGEARASGIIRGCSIFNLSISGSDITFDISSGVFVSEGIRREFEGFENKKFSFSNNFYICFDKNGCLVAQEETLDLLGNLSSPFNHLEFIHLAYVNISNSSKIDLRLFLDNLDLKTSAKIIVSNKKEYAHFDNVYAAVKYAKMLSKILRSIEIPEIYISSGEYEVSDTIEIDFDLKIKGNKTSSVLKRSGNLLLVNNVSDGSISNDKPMLLIGKQDATAIPDIDNGVSIEDIIFNCAITSGEVSNSILITDGRSNHTFRISGCKFIGPSGISQNSRQEVPICVQFKNQFGFLFVGSGGNLIIKDNHFIKCGNEAGGILWSTAAATSDYNNIIIQGNIIDSASPNILTSSSDYVYFIADIDLNYTASIMNPLYTYKNIIIVGNTYNEV